MGMICDITMSLEVNPKCLKTSECSGTEWLGGLITLGQTASKDYNMH